MKGADRPWPQRRQNRDWTAPRPEAGAAELVKAQQAELRRRMEDLQAARTEVEALHQDLFALARELERTRAQAQQRVETAAAVLDTVWVPTLVLGQGLRVYQANRAFYRAYDAEPLATLGWPLARVGGAAWHSNGLVRGLREVEAGERLEGREYSLMLDRGEVCSIAVHATRVQVTGADPNLVVCCIQDITRQRGLERQLIERAEQLGGTSTGILLVDSARRVTFANRSAEELLGYGSGAMAGRRLPEAIPLALGGAAGGDPPQRMAGDAWLERPDGTRVQVHWRIHAARRYRQAVTVIELRDLVMERQIMHSLLQSEKLAASGQMAATLAHEINNPLGAAANALYLLQEAGPQAHTGALVAAARQELQRVARIVRNTLGLHRSATGAEAADLGAEVDGVLELLRPRLRRGGMRVERRLRAGRHPAVPAGELRQMLTNLLANAVDALEARPGGGRLSVASYDAAWGGGAGVRLLIGDNAAGVTPELRARLFDAFVTSKGEKGTGLGLWVTAELARRHRGRVRVKSWNAPPSGTVFALELPAAG